MPLEFIISSKRRSILVHEGYEFWLKKKSLNGNMNWRCTKHQSLKCPVTLVTDRNKIIKQLSTHNHGYEREKAMAKNELGKMKERMTATTATTTASVLKSTIRNMSVNSVRGVELKKVISFLNSFAPLSLSESWDNTGLLVEPTTPKSIENILLTNDLTEDVVTEALQLNAGLIVSYHPPIFQGLKRITTSSWKERIIAACLENKVAVYSPHTSWDSVSGGVNDWLAGAFDSEIITPIKPHAEPSMVNAGAGRLCKLKNSIKLNEAVERVKKLTSLNYLSIAVARGATLDSLIKSVAICAGSGSSVLNNVQADLYLTGEMSHHSLLDAVHQGASVILCNHSNSERGFLKEFATKLEKVFSGCDVNVFVSKNDKDPLQTV